MDAEKKPGATFAVMFGGPKAKGPSMGGGDDEEAEGEGMGGARKSAVKAIAKALGSQGADLDSLDSALQAFVEACQGGYEE
jgi:hypothetical protein